MLELIFTIVIMLDLLLLTGLIVWAIYPLLVSLIEVITNVLVDFLDTISEDLINLFGLENKRIERGVIMGIPTIYTTEEIKGRSIENVETKNLTMKNYKFISQQNIYELSVYDKDGDEFLLYSHADEPNIYPPKFRYELYDYVACVRIKRSIRMNRKEALELAIKTVCEDRQDIHGAPEDCFALIGEYWSKYLDIKIDSVDVARMMMFFKMARLMMNPKHIDNYIDLMGYAALTVELMGDDEP